MTVGRSNSPSRPAGWQLPLGVAAGAGIGMIVGILLDQLAMGLIIGAAIGLLVATSAIATAATPTSARGRVLALAIGLVTAGVVVILWLLWW